MRDDVVGIGGGDETGNGNADALGENAGSEITEIAAGDGDDERNGSHRQLAIRGDVIEHLRKKAANVDGIGGSEKGALVELFVGEGLFDEALAIVEGAADFEGGDVLAQRGELLFLGFADALGRIKNDDANAGNAEKAVSNGAAGVTGSGDQNRERRRFAAHEIAHETGHEPRAKILEGQRGAVEKFEDVERGGKRNELHGKIDGFRDDLPENFFGNIGRGERAHEAKADFGKGQTAKFLQLFGECGGRFPRACTTRHREPGRGEPLHEER